MRHAAALLAALTLALVPTAASAAAPVTEEFRRVPGEPWQVIPFGGPQDVTARGGVVTIGPGNILGLNETYANDWAGTANRATGWTLDFRMRLDTDATQPCLEPGGVPPTLMFIGDTTDTVLLGFAAGEVCIYYPDPVTVAVDTEQWRTYRLTALGQHLTLTVDGQVVLDRTLAQPGAGSLALFLETHEGTSSWDHLTYDTSPGHRCTVRGTPGDDELVGTWRRDVICGGGGDDVLRGLGGDDLLIGGLGDDTLVGGGGDDLLQGGWGQDELDARLGDDRVEGGRGDDHLVASQGPDGADTLSGGPGHDVVDYSARTAGVGLTLGSEGDDGAPGEGDSVGAPVNPMVRLVDVEELVGGSGDDLLAGWMSRETLTGGPGADVLQGGDESDELRGEDGVAGNDRLDGQRGEDLCTGDPDDVLFSCNDPEPDPTPSFPLPPWPPVTPSPTAAPAPPALPSPSTAGLARASTVPLG